MDQPPRGGKQRPQTRGSSPSQVGVCLWVCAEGARPRARVAASTPADVSEGPSRKRARFAAEGSVLGTRKSWASFREGTGLMGPAA